MRGSYFVGIFTRGLPLAENRFDLSLPGQFQKSFIRGFPNSTVYGIIVTRTYLGGGKNENARFNLDQ